MLHMLGCFRQILLGHTIQKKKKNGKVECFGIQPSKFWRNFQLERFVMITPSRYAVEQGVAECHELSLDALSSLVKAFQSVEVRR